MYERILVPLDGSKLSELVLPHVEALAERFGSTVMLIRVNSSSYAPATTLRSQESPSPHANEQLVARGQLTAVGDGLRAKNHAVQLLLPTGGAAEGILEAARATGADLIAMTTHGAGGLGRLFFGSVADEVLRKAPCPVLLVRVDESIVRRAHLENVVF